MIICPDFWNDAACGRLGNKLFILAAAQAHAIRHNHELVLPYCPLLDQIAKPPHSVMAAQLPRGTMTFHQRKFSYVRIAKPRNAGEIQELYGHYQSYKYWCDYEHIIYSMIQPRPAIYRMACERMRDFGSEVVSIGVRRGDYLNKQHYHLTMPVEYYKRAISYFPEASAFVVFSDDVEWCKEHLDFPKVHVVEESDPWKALWMMSRADHYIIGNSTFHWWGARLNQSLSKRVIAPETWFNNALNAQTHDLIPPTWLRIPCN